MGRREGLEATIRVEEMLLSEGAREALADLGVGVHLDGVAQRNQGEARVARPHLAVDREQESFGQAPGPMPDLAFGGREDRVVEVVARRFLRSARGRAPLLPLLEDLPGSDEGLRHAGVTGPPLAEAPTPGDLCALAHELLF